ncbi:MAG: hypothetical protein ACHREM_03395 [Polyangiales bacterium]
MPHRTNHNYSIHMSSQQFSGAVLGEFMEAYQTPSEYRPLVTTIISTLRRLGFSDLHEASREILFRIAEGNLGSLRDLERLAHLLDNAKLAEAATFVFLDRTMTLDGLEEMIRSRTIVDSATALVSNLELRIGAKVPLKSEERRDLLRLRKFLNEALPSDANTSDGEAT